MYSKFKEQFRIGGGPFGFGESRRRSASSPPAPTPGQTLAFRANLAYTGTINSGSPSNFDSVTGTAYARQVGPRFGPADDPSWTIANGSSARIPISTNFRGEFQSAYNSSVMTRGMACGWIKLAPYFGDTSYTRAINTYGRSGGGDPTWAGAGVVFKRTTSGEEGLTLGMYMGNTGIVGEVEVGDFYQWIYICTYWDYVGAGGIYLGTYYKLLGETSLTRLGVEYQFFADWRGHIVAFHSTANDLVGVAGWNGAFGGLSVYELSDRTLAGTYPNDLVPPVERVYDMWVNPSGSGANAGFGGSANGLSYANLQTELSRNTFLGSHLGHANTSNVRQRAENITTDALGGALADEIDAGTVTPRGMRLRFAGDTVVPLGSDQINLEKYTGAIAQVEAGSSLSARLDLSAVVWTNVSGNIWKYTSANLATACIEEDGYLFTKVDAANEAAAITALTGPRMCWADSTGIYGVFAASGNPNTNGLAKSCGVPFAVTGDGPGLIALGDGQVCGTGMIDVGPMARYSAGVLDPQYAVSMKTGCVTVVDGNLRLKGGVKHQLGGVGNIPYWFHYRRGMVSSHAYVTNGLTDWTTDVSYCSETATLGTGWDGWTDCDFVDGEAVVLPGEQPSDYRGASAIYVHSNPGRTTTFATGMRIRNSRFAGYFNFGGLVAANGIDVSTAHFSWVTGATDGSAFDRCKIYSPSGGEASFAGSSVTITNSILCDGSWQSGTDSTNLAGTLTLDRCTIDTRDYDFVGTGNAIWKDNGDFVLNLTNSAVIANGSMAVLVKNGESSGDDVNISNTAFLGSATPTVLGQWNDGSTTADRTYAQAVTLGLITVSAVSASIGLDDADDYAVQSGSPVIGVADGATDEDYTGAVLARISAGARELVA